MGTIELRLQNLESDELMNAEFATDADALAWLAERPKFVQVLGLATSGLAHERIDALKAATRPLDADEKELSRKLEAKQRARVEELMAAEAARAQAVMEQHQAAMKNADPNRPLTIQWSLAEGMRNGEAGDARPITDAAREAVLAWIAERNTWVEERGLEVTEASVTVWPGPMPPAAGGQRVQRGGAFTPTPKK